MTMGWETFDNTEEWLKAIRKNMEKREYDGEDEQAPKKVTDIEAAKENINAAVHAFNERYASVPRFALDVEVMDQRQLRDAMGLRATIDAGDPWPAAEKLLLELGFRWQWLSGQRVMFVQERESFVPGGWDDGEEVDEEREDDAVSHCGLDTGIPMA